jgi:hypothetical protein
MLSFAIPTGGDRVLMLANLVKGLLRCALCFLLGGLPDIFEGSVGDGARSRRDFIMLEVRRSWRRVNACKSRSDVWGMKLSQICFNI